MYQRITEPGMIERWPRWKALSDSRATCSAEILPGTGGRWPASYPATSCHSVGTGPGFTHNARTPVPRSSALSASLKFRAKALDAL